MIRLHTKPFTWKKPLLSLFFWATFFFSVTAYGATYYVDNSGDPSCSDNQGDGSESNPWCTISYAISRISGGDTLYVKSGTYIGPWTISDVHASEEDPTVIQAYPGHTVTIQGNGVNNGRVKIDNCHYLTFDGFEITNFNQGLFIEGGSTYVTIQNLTVHYIGQEGIHVRENSSYITIDSNTIYDTDQYIYNGEGVYIGTGSGGPFDNSHHITVSNNIIHDVGDEAVELKPGTHDCTVEGNVVYNAISSQKWGAIEVNEAVLGVQHWDSNPNHVIRNNIIHDVDTAIRVGTGSTVYNNVIYDVDSGDYGIYINNRANDSYTRVIYHNTVDVSSSNAIYTAAGTTDIKNNIGPSTTNNMATDSSYFVSTAEGGEDYHLVSGSAPIDAGLDLTGTVATDIDGDSRPSSSAPDYGADEYSHNTNAPGAPKNLRIIPN